MYLSMLSIRSEKIWVFGAWFGNKFADNTKYFYLYMQQNKDIQCIWITKSKEIYDELQKGGFKAYMYNSPMGVWYQLRAKYVFICGAATDVNEYLIGNAFLINLLHGTGGKKSGYADKINKYNSFSDHNLSIIFRSIPQRKSLVVATSRQMYDAVRETFRVEDNQIINMGFTRNDVFFREFPNDTSRVFEDVNDYILYLPTHRQEGRKKINLEELMNLKHLDSLCEKFNVKFIIKKHFYHNSETTDVSKYPSILDLTGTDYDTQLLMKNAKMVITDYSSCYVDYLLLNRPVGFFCYDLEEYQKNDRELVCSYESTTPGFKAYNFQELLLNLEVFLSSGTDKYEEERQRVRRIFYDDYACKSVSPYLEEFVISGKLKKQYYGR